LSKGKLEFLLVLHVQCVVYQVSMACQQFSHYSLTCGIKLSQIVCNTQQYFFQTHKHALKLKNKQRKTYCINSYSDTWTPQLG